MAFSTPAFAAAAPRVGGAYTGLARTSARVCTARSAPAAARRVVAAPPSTVTTTPTAKMFDWKKRADENYAVGTCAQGGVARCGLHLAGSGGGRERWLGVEEDVLSLRWALMLCWRLRRWGERWLGCGSRRTGAGGEGECVWRRPRAGLDVGARGSLVGSTGSV